MIWIILAVIVLCFLIYGIACVLAGLSYTSSVNQIEEDDIELKHREFWKRQKRNRRK